jgi:3-isopropylmalate/(R)-2-methylmalate dehydratase large subunit
MAGLHAVQKILAAHAHPKRERVVPGEYIEIEPDIFSVIVSFNPTEAEHLVSDLAELGVTELPIRDKIIAFSDHGSPAASASNALGHKRWRDFYRAYGVRVMDGGAGISHVVLPEQGIAVPGGVIINKDSHAPTVGAVGAFGTSLGGGRLTLYAIGRYFIEVPGVTLVRLHGKLGKGVHGRDVALKVNGVLGQRGALGTVVEFVGDYVDAAPMDMRFTLCNMAPEIGAVAAYIQPDATTLAYVGKRSSKVPTVFETDRGFEYQQSFDIDVSTLDPQVAAPHASDNVKPLSEVAGTPIDQAYLGSCASGRLEDMAVAAAVLKGRKVHHDVRFIVTPGSREVLVEATRLGYIDIMHAAQAIVTNANCGACPGLHGGILAPGEVAITSITRNTRGRMGRDAEIYLASPASVAASAVAGCIASPLDYL